MRLKLITALAIATTVVFSVSSKDTKPVYPSGDKALKQYFIDNLPYQPTVADKTITLMLKIDAEGNVTQALPQVADDKLKAAVVKTAMTLPQFVPGTVNGKAAPAWLKVVVPLVGKKSAPKLEFVTDYTNLTEIIIVNDEDFGRDVAVAIPTPTPAAEPVTPQVEKPSVTASNSSTAALGKIYRASEVTSGPEFPGGERALTQYIQEHLQNPVGASQTTTGTVLIKAVISADGSVANTAVVRGMSSDHDAEALRVVNNLPHFTPATHKGKPVNCQRIITIYFSTN